MSDSMERDKIDSMVQKEIKEEEEEMKRELLDMGMYESWYTYKEMKEVLCFISESKNMANMTTDNKNANKESAHASDATADTMSKTNVSQELESQDHTDVSRPIHSYRANHASPTPDQISTHSSSSPESMSTIFESRNSSHRRKSSDIDDMFDRCSHENLNIRDATSHSTNRYVSLRSKNSLQESHNTHSAEMKMNAQSEHNQKLDRWTINPLDCCVNENDVPLRQPERPVVQDREPFRFCKDAQTPEMLEKVLPALNLHLKQMAELWHSWHRTTDSKFQWGSPIQVGTANGSLDKKPLTNTKNEPSKKKCTVKQSYELSNKRKSTLLLSPPNMTQFSSDEDENAEFISVKKKKIQYDRQERASRSSRSVKETARAYEESRSSSHLKDDEDFLLDNEPSSINSNENMISEVREKMQSEKRLSPELISEYPRRIIPPNPRKYINSSKKKKAGSTSTKNLVTRSNDEQENVASSRSEKKDNVLDEQSILTELEKDDDDNAKTTAKNVTIKPLLMKRLSVRLEKQSNLLKKVHEEQQRKKEAEKEEARRKEEEEKRKREEFFKKQEEERQRRQRQREEAQRIQMEKSTKWNNVLSMKSKETKDRSIREQEAIRLSEIEEENRLLQDDDEEEECPTNAITCPICNKPFPREKIEAHAAACEQFNTDNDEGNSNVATFQRRASSTKRNSRNVGMFECSVCSVFKTDNGIDYEDHVNSCIQRQHERDSGQSQSREQGSNRIFNVPTSPIRCYRPISDLTDSEIDYKAQFGTSSKSFSRKRKR